MRDWSRPPKRTLLYLFFFEHTYRYCAYIFFLMIIPFSKIYQYPRIVPISIFAPTVLRTLPRIHPSSTASSTSSASSPASGPSSGPPSRPTSSPSSRSTRRSCWGGSLLCWRSRRTQGPSVVNKQNYNTKKTTILFFF